MRRWALQGLLLAALLALGFWAWRAMFPGPEQRIRQHLAELAQAVSFSSQESPLAKLAHARKLVAWFTPDAEVIIDTPVRQLVLHGADDLREAAVAARSGAGSLTLEFLDITVTVAPDGQSAVARLTVKAAVNRDKNAYVDELKITWQHLAGEWRISRIESVKTLSYNRPTEPSEFDEGFRPFISVTALKLRVLARG